jgi:hypothetical protein
MPDDRPTAALDAIRAENRSLETTSSPSWATVPKISRVIAGSDRLLAAVGTVLELHAPHLTLRSACPTHHAAIAACGSLRERAAYVQSLGHCDDCEYFPPRCAEDPRDLYPCNTIRAISRELLGEDANA